MPASPSRFSLSKAIPLLATSAGLATSWTVANIFSDKIWLTIPLTIVFTLMFFIVGKVSGLFSAVAKLLEEKWAERIANTIDKKISNLLPGYKKKYLQYINFQHRFFDTKGLTTQGAHTLELNRIYIDLRLDTKPINKTSNNPIATDSDELQNGSHSIWKYLQSQTLLNQHFVIVGTPGSGKTTLFKYMALALATTKKQNKDIPDKLPILLFLRDHAEAIRADSAISLAQLVRSRFAKWEVPTPPPDWIESRLEAGQFIIMLDGLDEVADPETRQCVVDWVEQRIVAHGKNRFILSSRPYGYRSNPINGVTVIEVLPFTNEQIKVFVHNWYYATEIMNARTDDVGIKTIAREGADDLLSRLRKSSSLSELAINPLLLTMIANVHRYRSSLPGRRIELYSEICDVLLGKRQQARGIEISLTPAQKQSVLQPLAYSMMISQEREIDVNRAVEVITKPLMMVNPDLDGIFFLKMVENTSGLLLERENGIYSFAHLTFQEYLAAVYIQENKLEGALIQHVSENWWHETIRLYCAQTDASSIIKACISDKLNTSVSALALALECLDEAREVQPEIRDDCKFLIEQGIESIDPEKKSLVAETLLSLRLRKLIRVSEDIFIDNSLISCAEYQLFIDDNQAKGRSVEPDHWLVNQFTSGHGNLPIAGLRTSDAIAFCNWLNLREGNTWMYRLLTSSEAEQNILEEQISTEHSYWVEQQPGGYIELAGQSVSPIEQSTTYLLDQIIVDYHAAIENFSRVSHDLRIQARASEFEIISVHDLNFSTLLKIVRSIPFNINDIQQIQERQKVIQSISKGIDIERHLLLLLPFQKEFNIMIKESYYNLFNESITHRIFDLSLQRGANHKHDLYKKGVYFLLLYIVAQWAKIDTRKKVIDHRSNFWQDIDFVSNIFWDLYCALSVIQARSRNRLPAFEGLRIAKERKSS